MRKGESLQRSLENSFKEETGRVSKLIWSGTPETLTVLFHTLRAACIVSRKEGVGENPKSTADRRCLRDGFRAVCSI